MTSREDCHCPLCGSPLSKRDKRMRIHRLAGGETEWYQINRLKCSNEKCGRLHNELPDCMVPYKHYDAQLIEDVIEGVVSEEDEGYEDYPCVQTMNHWKYWMMLNEGHIDGAVKSTADRLLGLGTGFVRSKGSLLEGLRNRISPGWLKAASGFLYNNGCGLLTGPG